MNKQNLYGLVLCGGKSSRMGEDKCFLNYHGKPQCYHVYEMLQHFCEETFISCNTDQSPLIDNTFKIIEDIETYANRGPATGVLSAFSRYPQKDLLVVGCDYPLLSAHELDHFLKSIPAHSVAAAFYDEKDQCYQPVLAWYSSEAGVALLKKTENTLKRFLENVNAYKHAPINTASLTNVDTKEARKEVLQLTNYNH